MSKLKSVNTIECMSRVAVNG